MINMKKVFYQVIFVPEKGSALDITDVVDNLGWEENKGELAVRINISMRNQKYNEKKLSSWIKINSYIAVMAKYGSKKYEAARGKIVTWETTSTGAKETLKITCYDELYDLQKSQDNIYYSSGTNTKSAIKKIFKKWNIPMGSYKGPNKKHGKLAYKKQAISEIILDILDDAVKKGSEKYVVQCKKSKIYIVPRGSNTNVYHFGTDNIVSLKNQQSSADMVTRVKILGKENDDGKSPVEDTVNGKTQYGIRQKISVRGKDESLSDAKSAAKEILKEKGDLKKTITVQSPDVPTIRRGNMVHIKARSLDGYYYILGIRHDANNVTMTMDLEKATAGNSAKTSSKSSSTTFKVGDKVILNGAVYVNSYGEGKGKTFKKRTGKITRKVSTKRKCPYHVDKIGWVYPNTIKKA